MALAVVFAAIGLIVVPHAFSAPTTVPTTEPGSFKTVTFFSATTTNATSTNQSSNGFLDITGAKKANVYVSRGGATNPNTGSTNFRIQVSNDLSTWYYFNQLVPNAATGVASTAPVTVASQTITAATSTEVLGLDLRFGAFRFLRCIAVETTDGEHSCAASAEF